MKKLAALSMAQAKLFVREPAAFFFTLVFPLLLILMFGFVFGNEPGGMGGPFGYIDYSTPAITAMIIVTVGLLSIPIQTATARENKILRRFRATPLHPATYVGATVVVYFVISIVGMVLTVLVAKALFGLRFAGSWWNMAAGFTLVASAFFSAGYLIASVAPTARVAQVMGQMLFFPMMFLSGAAMPLQIMPAGVQSVAEFLPMTHAVKLLQNLWFGQGWSGSWTHIFVMLATLVAGLLLSTRLFRWE